jgi:hypothetical protein
MYELKKGGSWVAKEGSKKSKDEKKEDGISEWGIEEEVLEQIANAVKQLKYGTVTIVIQDSRVIQIDKTEKMRLG